MVHLHHSFVRLEFDGEFFSTTILMAALEIIIILLLILMNGFFALAEIAVVSSRKSRLRQLENDGNRRARLALELAEKPSKFLSSVQLGVTLIGVVAGAFGSVTLAKPLAHLLAAISWLAPYREIVSLILVVSAITLATVVFGEIVPKQIALFHPEKYAMLTAAPMRFIAHLASPIVLFLSALSTLVIKIIGITPPTKSSITDEEVNLLFAEGVHSGVFEKTEREIVERVLRLSDRRVSAIMTPRIDIVWVDINATRDEIIRITADNPSFTAYPVFEESIDNVIGIIFAKAFIPFLLSENSALSRDLIVSPLILHEGMRTIKAIELIRQSHSHLALIINEYGETEGLVTATDILESIIGEMPVMDEPMITRREDGSYLIDGLTSLDEVQKVLNIDEFPEEEEGQYHTIGGFVMNFLGEVPDTGDAFTWQGYRFEVVDMDSHRIDQILVQHQEAK